MHITTNIFHIKQLFYEVSDPFTILTISEFSKISNFLSLDLSNALVTMDFANVPTEMDCFDEVSSLEAMHCPHLSINLDSPSLE